MQFCNDVCGLLNYKDVEGVHGRSRNEFVLGQTIKVYVSFVKELDRKLGLTLSKKGVASLLSQGGGNSGLLSMYASLKKLAQALPDSAVLNNNNIDG